METHLTTPIWQGHHVNLLEGIICYNPFINKPLGKQNLSEKMFHGVQALKLRVPERQNQKKKRAPRVMFVGL